MPEPNIPELRKLPQVDSLIEAIGKVGARPLAAEAARRAIDEARGLVLLGFPAPTLEALAEKARALIRREGRRRLVPVINATGVLLHTNLGRAPLARPALEAVERIAGGYSNLEYDLERGSRGSRYDHARELLTAVTGAEAALVVNNNAAAVLLALAALAAGREVIVSRGELIEIGGEFRIPEILASSGAVLREVGTTNRTHLRDYRQAITDQTAAILKVHPSNYRVVGFVASVPSAELARVAHERGLFLIHDLGSGLLRRRVGGGEPPWLAPEPTVADAVVEGADVVTFSGDKLLGGPQAGLLVGRAQPMAAMGRSPLLRALRVDKTRLAALEATLIKYLDGSEAELPLWEMALADAGEVESRAAAVLSKLVGAEAKIELAAGWSTTGGGSLPGGTIATVLIQIAPRQVSPNVLVRRLLANAVPIVARIEEDRVVLDLRTVPPAEDRTVAEALRRLLC
ncbi:MAG: L-seryl-tRNA(Sec) selenium transferase [Actinomycetota bacterium]